jgi:hypothetical protein
MRGIETCFIGRVVRPLTAKTSTEGHRSAARRKANYSASASSTKSSMWHQTSRSGTGPTSKAGSVFADTSATVPPRRASTSRLSHSSPSAGSGGRGRTVL